MFLGLGRRRRSAVSGRGFGGEKGSGACYVDFVAGLGAKVLVFVDLKDVEIWHPAQLRKSKKLTSADVNGHIPC